MKHGAAAFAATPLVTTPMPRCSRPGRDLLLPDHGRDRLVRRAGEKLDELVARSQLVE